jgi:hypothetical protein
MSGQVTVSRADARLIGAALVEAARARLLRGRRRARPGPEIAAYRCRLLRETWTGEGDGPGARLPTLEQIARDVAARTGVPLALVRGRGRTARVVAARHEIWRRAHLEAGMTLEEIGRAFDRDHSTVSYAVTKLKRRAARDGGGDDAR